MLAHVLAESTRVADSVKAVRAERADLLAHARRGMPVTADRYQAAQAVANAASERSPRRAPGDPGHDDSVPILSPWARRPRGRLGFDAASLGSSPARGASPVGATLGPPAAEVQPWNEQEPATRPVTGSCLSEGGARSSSAPPRPTPSQGQGRRLNESVNPARGQQRTHAPRPCPAQRPARDALHATPAAPWTHHAIPDSPGHRTRATSDPRPGTCRRPSRPGCAPGSGEHPTARDRDRTRPTKCTAASGGACSGTPSSGIRFGRRRRS